MRRFLLTAVECELASILREIVGGSAFRFLVLFVLSTVFFLSAAKRHRNSYAGFFNHLLLNDLTLIGGQFSMLIYTFLNFIGGVCVYWDLGYLIGVFEYKWLGADFYRG